MSFNPIDIIRTQEAAQIKHMQNQRTQYMQDQLGKNFQQIIEQEKHKPTELTKTENSEYRYDAKEKGNNQYQGNTGGRKEKKKEKEKPKNSKDPATGRLDVLI